MTREPFTNAHKFELSIENNQEVILTFEESISEVIESVENLLINTNKMRKI